MAGAYDYIAKPFNVENKILVKNALEKRTLTRGTSAGRRSEDTASAA
jgi:DNA-binding NtrC family response regulator